MVAGLPFAVFASHPHPSSHGVLVLDLPLRYVLLCRAHSLFLGLFASSLCPAASLVRRLVVSRAMSRMAYIAGRLLQVRRDHAGR